MGKEIDALSEANRASFRANIERLGLSPEKVTHHDTLVTGPGPTILSGDPKESKLPATLIEIKSIKHLKQLVGIPDEAYISGKLSDVGIDYPPELEASRLELIRTSKNICDLLDNLTLEERGDLKHARESFIQGNSEKSRSYEKLIDAVNFPAQLAVFSVDTIIVKPGNPLILTGPPAVDLHAASIIVASGGQIIVKYDARITTQLFEAQ